MLTELCESFEVLGRARSQAALSLEIARFSKRCECERFAYALRTIAAASTSNCLRLTNYNPSWIQSYLTRGYFQMDPIALHCARSSLPAIWDEPAFHEDDAKQFWDEAKAYGLRSGVSFSIPSQSGMFGILSLSRDRLFDVKGCALAALIGRAQVFAVLLQEAVLRIGVPTIVPNLTAPLTKRERECLRWVAEGKTAREIGDILNVAERTAVYHIDNASLKLNAVNKTHAVVRALMLNILF